MSKIQEMFQEMDGLMKKYGLKRVEVVYPVGSITMTTTLTNGEDEPCRHDNVDEYFEKCDDCGASLTELAGQPE